MKRLLTSLVGCGVLLVLVTASAHGDFISGRVEGPGGAGAVTITGGGANLNVTKTFTAFDYLDLIFEVDAAGTYTINPEGITNATGVDWLDFHWVISDGGTITELGGTEFANFTISPDMTQGTADGGTVPTGMGFFATLEISLPAAGTYSIRQTPSVPEPAAFALTGSGLALLGLARLRRRRAAG